MTDKYCKDCVKANAKEHNATPMWYCGKHRRFITEHSLATRDYKKECEHYERRK